jgi:cytochrome c peroxidase
MKRLVSWACSPAWKLLSRRRMLAVPILFLLTAAAVFAGISLFKVYIDNTGTVLTASSNPTTLNATNPFFDPSIGTNGQACVTCHEPQTGITITPPKIQEAFDGTGGTDPLFRPNNTANNPHIPRSQHTASDYSLFLKLGTARTAKTLPASRDFEVAAADAATDAKFAAPEMFPLMMDPQHPGTPTLSEFRRPLVNVNVNFESSVLWDGRENIATLATSQVPKAIQTMLLGPGADPTVNQAISDFMTGVYVGQKSDNAAGQLDDAGATGGVQNLLALSQSPSRPCVFDDDNGPIATTSGDITPFVEAVAATTCTPVVGGGPNFNLFQAWETLSPNNSLNAARLSIARGEVIFNTSKGGCTACHSVNNLGNNPSANFMIREGHDSITRLQAIQTAAANSGDANAADEAQRIQDMIDRASLLPFYCMRSTAAGAPPLTGAGAVPCGSFTGAAGIPGDDVNSDPARAMVTGRFSDVGKQKPPILRNLSVRAPFFHNGDAVDLQHLVTFYKFFRHLTLTPTDEQDLINFLNAL